MTNFAIDLYCERLDSSFWAEPINALTNMAFIVASLMAFYVHQKAGLQNSAYRFLCFLLFCIGVGSFLFHTFANSYSELADTIPIWTFVVCYLYYANRLVFEQSYMTTLKNMAIVLCLAVFGFLMSQTNANEGQTVLNGSVQYAPALFFLLVYTYYLYHKNRQLYLYALSASLVFLVSLTFRTLDMQWCSQFSIGLHFMWHILNAIMLFLLLYIIHFSLLLKSQANED